MTIEAKAASRASRDPTSLPRLLSAQAAAQYLGVPYTSLRDWALRGHVPIVRVPECKRLWFDRRDLDQAIESWKERAVS
jgi:predicted site-specific integrase-resolvase